MGKFEMGLKGSKEVQKEIRKAKKKLEHKQLENIFKNGADMMTKEGKQRASQGQKGNLRKAIITKKQGENPLVYLSAVDRQIAPHAHLVEYGTGPRYHKSTGKYIGQMPAQPFWRPSWDGIKARAESYIIRELRRRVGGG